mmetsp:Transcript_80792/g.127472  ORF Transcript_80792/g.127472 Transcript_80792/m.127472 type:complete len:177 (-) Transcript_80792:74-604(-)
MYCEEAQKCHWCHGGKTKPSMPQYPQRNKASLRQALSQIFGKPKELDDILDDALWLGLINPIAAKTMRQDVRSGKNSESFYIEKWEARIDETKSVHRKVKETLALTKSQPENVKAVFQAWDTDSNGVISEDELRKALQDLDVSLTREQLRSAILLADADADGVVKYEEFVTWIFSA